MRRRSAKEILTISINNTNTYINTIIVIIIVVIIVIIVIIIIIIIIIIIPAGSGGNLVGPLRKVPRALAEKGRVREQNDESRPTTPSTTPSSGRGLGL